MRNLTGTEFEAARNALISGFFKYSDLEQLAAFVLDLNLEAEVGTGGLKKVAFDLLKLTESEGWTEILLREAAARKPGNAELHAIVQQLGLAPAPFRNAAGAPPGVGSGGWEAIVLEASGMAKSGEWRRRMIDRERKVCQILFQSKPVATGFLVAPDLVMSNWHAFEYPPNSGQLGDLRNYQVRFDFRAADEEHVASPGTTVALDVQEGYRDKSHKEELDYVIVKLARSVGAEVLPGGEKRGFLGLGTRPFAVNEPALLLQHPYGRTLEFAIGPVLGWLPSRVNEIYEHLANTEEGASGSPCFACDWTLFGLHHRTDPQTGARNRAVATTAILERMGAIGTIGLLPAV